MVAYDPEKVDAMINSTPITGFVEEKDLASRIKEGYAIGSIFGYNTGCSGMAYVYRENGMLVEVFPTEDNGSFYNFFLHNPLQRNVKYMVKLNDKKLGGFIPTDSTFIWTFAPA